MDPSPSVLETKENMFSSSWPYKRLSDWIDVSPIEVQDKKIISDSLGGLDIRWGWARVSVDFVGGAFSFEWVSLNFLWGRGGGGLMMGD